MRVQIQEFPGYAQNRGTKATQQKPIYTTQSAKDVLSTHKYVKSVADDSYRLFNEALTQVGSSLEKARRESQGLAINEIGAEWKTNIAEWDAKKSDEFIGGLSTSQMAPQEAFTLMSNTIDDEFTRFEGQSHIKALLDSDPRVKEVWDSVSKSNKRDALTELTKRYNIERGVRQGLQLDLIVNDWSSSVNVILESQLDEYADLSESGVKDSRTQMSFVNKEQISKIKALGLNKNQEKEAIRKATATVQFNAYLHIYTKKRGRDIPFYKLSLKDIKAKTPEVLLYYSEEMSKLLELTASKRNITDEKRANEISNLHLLRGISQLETRSQEFSLLKLGDIVNDNTHEFHGILEKDYLRLLARARTKEASKSVTRSDPDLRKELMHILGNHEVDAQRGRKVPLLSDILKEEIFFKGKTVNFFGILTPTEIRLWDETNRFYNEVWRSTDAYKNPVLHKLSWEDIDKRWDEHRDSLDNTYSKIDKQKALAHINKSREKYVSERSSYDRAPNDYAGEIADIKSTDTPLQASDKRVKSLRILENNDTIMFSTSESDVKQYTEHIAGLDGPGKVEFIGNLKKIFLGGHFENPEDRQRALELFNELVYTKKIISPTLAVIAQSENTAELDPEIVDIVQNTEDGNINNLASQHGLTDAEKGILINSIRQNRVIALKGQSRSNQVRVSAITSNRGVVSTDVSINDRKWNYLSQGPPAAIFGNDPTGNRHGNLHQNTTLIWPKIVNDAIDAVIVSDLKRNYPSELYDDDGEINKEVVLDAAYRASNKLFKNTVVVENTDPGGSSFTLNKKRMDPYLKEVAFETPIALTAAAGELTSRLMDEGAFTINPESIPELDAYLKTDPGRKFIADMIRENYWIPDPSRSFVWLNAGDGEYQLHLKIRPEDSKSQRLTFPIKGMIINEKEFHDIVYELEFYRWADDASAPLGAPQGFARLKDQLTLKQWLAFNENTKLENLSEVQKIKIEKFAGYLLNVHNKNWAPKQPLEDVKMDGNGFVDLVKRAAKEYKPHNRDTTITKIAALFGFPGGYGDTRTKIGDTYGGRIAEIFNMSGEKLRKWLDTSGSNVTLGGNQRSGLHIGDFPLANFEESEVVKEIRKNIFFQDRKVFPK